MAPAFDRLDYEPDGHLTVASMMILGGLDGRAFGDAIGYLLARAGTLTPDAQAVACDAIERAVDDARNEGREVDFDPAALVGIWRGAFDDPTMTGVARVAVRLMLAQRFGPAEIFASLPSDPAGQEIRDRLDSDLKNASAKAMAPLPAGDGSAPDDESIRGIEFPSPDAAPTAEGGPKRTAELTIGSDTLELSGLPEGEQRRVIQDWMARHAADAGRTYSAYGRLACNEVVPVGEAFELEVGLSPTQSPGVAGPAMTLVAPEPSSGYFVDVQLFADGFDIGAGESWRQSIEVSSGELHPMVTVHLTPRPIRDEMTDREISATFSIEGETLGFAQRFVRVTRAPDRQAATPVTVPQAGGVNIPAPSGDPKADLTIVIKKGVEAGTLLWSIESALPGVSLDGDEPPNSSIGDEPEKFAVNLIRTLFTHGSAPGLLDLLRGRGARIRDAMPDGVMRAIEAAAAATSPAPPQILLLTDEPYVPWELTLLDDPWIADAPPFLAAQADVGRWILRSRTIADPPRSVDGSQMAVVWGVYEGPSLQRLVSAEEEAKELKKTYHAASITAEGLPVRELLNGTPPADILHFAVHGKFDPQAATEGIQLVKGPPVVPDQIGGSNLRDRAPFVFLNACQIGSAQTVLGGYGGVAHAFLEAGASAVVAPLWSIDDGIAKGIALTFYEQALAAAPGASAPTVAGLLRQARHGLFDTAEAPSATYLAYQFYGHPSLRLTWEGGSNG